MENDTKEIPQHIKGQRRNNEREAELSAGRRVSRVVQCNKY